MNVPAALSCGALLRRRSSFESFVANPQKLKTSVFRTSHFFLRTVSRGVQKPKTSYFCGKLLPRNNPKFFLFASGVDLVVGRLGFEPRQRDSKSLDLPLVDRPVHRRLQQLDLISSLPMTGEVTLRTSVPNTRLSAGSPSGAPARQRTGRAAEPPLHPLQTGKVQTEQSRNLIAQHK